MSETIKLDEPRRLDIDRESVERAYDRWAPIYDLVFGGVFGKGRHAAIVATNAIGRRAGGRRDRTGLVRGEHREAGEAGEPVSCARAGWPGHRRDVEDGAAAAGLGQHAEGAGDPGHRHILGRRGAAHAAGALPPGN